LQTEEGGDVPGFAITSLTLSYFRSHRVARLTFDGRPVALVGANGVGKTNLLEAVSLLSPGRGLRRAEGLDLARKPEGLGWKVRADVQGISAAHEIETWAEPGETRHVRIDGKAATQAALGRVMRVLWLVPAMDRLWIEAAEGRRRFLDRMTLSFAPDHAEAVLGYDKAMRDRNRLLKDQITDARWYSVVESQMAAAATAIMANRVAAVARLRRRFRRLIWQSQVPPRARHRRPKNWLAFGLRRAGVMWQRDARSWGRTARIWRLSMWPRGWLRRSAPPVNRRRSLSALFCRMRGHWRQIWGRHLSCCSMRWPHIWIRHGARHFMMRFARWVRKRL
jgi:energy-coupling factor transporter ATP-binding protein EcfA2